MCDSPSNLKSKASFLISQHVIHEITAGTLGCYCPLIPRCQLLQHKPCEFFWIESFTAGGLVSEYWAEIVRRRPEFEDFLGDEGVHILECHFLAGFQEIRPNYWLPPVCRVVVFAESLRSRSKPVISFFLFFCGANC